VNFQQGRVWRVKGSLFWWGPEDFGRQFGDLLWGGPWGKGFFLGAGFYNPFWEEKNACSTILISPVDFSKRGAFHKGSCEGPFVKGGAKNFLRAFWGDFSGKLFLSFPPEGVSSL